MQTVRDITPCGTCKQLPVYYQCKRDTGLTHFIRCNKCQVKTDSFRLFADCVSQWNRRLGSEPINQPILNVCKKCKMLPRLIQLSVGDEEIHYRAACIICKNRTVCTHKTKELAIKAWNSVYGNAN